jgi:HD-GYP domain-containing protein (c-di-GMP phosphodiesterase class II)
MTNDSKTVNTGNQLEQIPPAPGERFARALYWLVQTVRIHRDNNRLLKACVDEFLGAVSNCLEDEEHFTLQIFRGRFYLQDKKVIYRMESMDLIKAVLDFFERCGIAGLRIYAKIDEASVEQILAFARLLNQVGRQGDTFAWLSQRMEGREFSWVEIIQGADTNNLRLSGNKRKEMARRAYFNAMSSVREVAQKLASQQPAGLRKVKRIAQNLVDLLMEDDILLFQLSTIRDYDDYTYTHSVNVAILSLCLGKRVGLSRRSLEMLGICGLLHDLGKVDVPQEILNKPGKLTESEFEEVRKHPLKSMLHVLKMPTDQDLKTKIITPIFEHHLKYDLSGYPHVDRGSGQTFFARILSMADVFDAMTSIRVYRNKAFSPDHALSSMLEGSGREFDPILLKVMVNLLGVYPVGTLLRLDTGEMGLVIQSNGGTDHARPQVLILLPDEKGGFRKGKVFSLAEQDPKTLSFTRNVVRSLHPSDYGIQPAEFLL